VTGTPLAPAFQLDFSDSERGHSRTGTGPGASILGAVCIR